MTPKEKALELVDKFWDKLYAIPSFNNPTELAEQSKQCGLICVDEILEFHDRIDVKYWKKVKKEIEKL